jgi:hypothetical protein
MTLYAHTYWRPASRVAAALSRWWPWFVPGRVPAVAPGNRRHALMAAVDARRDDALARRMARR